MRILYCTEQYFPLQTGTAIADYGLTSALAQAGHQVYCVTSNMFTHMGIDMPLKRKGECHAITSGSTTKQALEIAPHLYVVEFAIHNENWMGQEEIEHYIDFTKNFECDILINSSILTWNSDAIYAHLHECRAKKKFLRNHVEYAKRPFDWLRRCLSDARKAMSSLQDKQYQEVWKILWNRCKCLAALDSHPLRKVKKYLKHYDIIFLLHKNSHLWTYLADCHNLDILPNGVFAQEIKAPKCLTFSPPPPRSIVKKNLIPILQVLKRTSWPC
ncbi:hypothetical protein [Helicobacter heilmannii]|uniref:hypothetical protein n=1 Tax=Helicobacter heilmannii TaxID=35817 RepID=UPI0006A0E4B4|nr:hypothetical protein [Helicobacter heilmannii]CRF46669.1 hypothetical protein HHE014_16860 [Helicobacter heilmannii]